MQACALRRCACGHEHHPDDARYVGAQECGDGELAMLFNCPGCKSTYADGVLTDAAVCCMCRHAIVGDAEDPKVVALIDNGAGIESLIFCLDCDHKHLPHRKPPAFYVPMAARMY